MRLVLAAWFCTFCMLVGAAEQSQPEQSQPKAARPAAVAIPAVAPDSAEARQEDASAGLPSKKSFQRPKLQIINGSEQTIDVFWLKSEQERVPNGSIDAGVSTFIDTTIGHRFALVGRDDKKEVTVTVEVPIQAIRFDPPDPNGIPAFYAQRAEANGYPVVGSAQVNPFAVKEAVHIVNQMLAQRPDVRDAMIRSGSRLCILAFNEFTTDQPEFRRLGKQPVPRFSEIPGREYWDARARGLGGSEHDPFCSCAEENLLGYPGDPYHAECILIHEFAHNIHLRGLVNVDPTFDTRLKAAYRKAMKAGLWKGAYASVNHHEYFAEGVQSWFDNNRENDQEHNHVNTRAELLEHDPDLAAICREVFGDTQIKYTKPATRLVGHLAGYSPTQAPTFVWPERLNRARALIQESVRKRNRKAHQTSASQSSAGNEIESHFSPPKQWENQYGDYRSPLLFQDGRRVKTADDWQRRRAEIVAEWTGWLGQWPPLITEPDVEILGSERRENFVQHRIRFAWTPNEKTTGYLLIPDGPGKRPAVVTVFYEPETAIGHGKSDRDFALQLARRGFVTLSIGTTEASKARTYALYYPSIEAAEVQPLSMLGYAAANAWYVLAGRPEVDADRIGIVGHSFGGKWAMFASCLFDKFACAAWSDPGTVFDETRPSVNYWEPWYLGYHPKPWRKRGIITPENPARGLYPRLRDAGHDLHELHALMAPRPFLVSGGSEDPPRRWEALNHTVSVNHVLGYENRVGMTNRPDHSPNAESNAVIYAFFQHFLRKE